MLQDVCVRTISVLSFIDNAAGCLCQNDRCVIVHRQCCGMFVTRMITVLLSFTDNAAVLFVSE